MSNEQIEDQKFYGCVWENVLSNIFNLSKPEIDDWIALNRKSWEKFHAVYVSEFPEYWVMDAIIPEDVCLRIGAFQTKRLKRDLVDAIEAGNPKWSANEGYDWPAARERVKRVLTGYGVGFDALGKNLRS
jgi:hypothetical protein